jgi:two-component system alkaline phosphatase synthesis response regulator PhoP
MARILVVDDEESVREFISDLLAMGGHAVDQACDGLEAVSMARKKRYDLVILDRIMPKTDGIMTLTILRCDPKLQGLKVLVCTSVSVNKAVEEAFAAGADDYILKPINIQALLAKVQALLGKS